jgi:thiol-disulfide isomerase/thioredoxin
MKKLLLVLSLPVLLITACDKIKNPIEIRDTVVGKTFITKSNKNVSGFYKVLLEDYTGATCGNCPKAAHVADTLAIQYGNKIVVVAVHAGGYAVPELPHYPNYYGTPAGETWFKNQPIGFGFATAGNPNGMINRKIYPGNNLIVAYTKWKSTVPYALLNDPFRVKLDVTTNYDPDVRALNTNIMATFLSDYPNDVKLSALLLEDDIDGHQKDYRYFPDLDTTYVFHDMLRASLKDTWGDILKTAPIYQDDIDSLSYQGFPVDSKYNDKKLSVVVFAYDAQTLEVLQVEKVKIR